MAQLKETGRLLAETELKAPFSGTITNIMIEPGEFASPGRPVVEISGDGALELQVEVPETVISHVAPESAVNIKLPFASNRMIKGKINAVSKAAIGSGRLFPLKIKIVDVSGVSSGMTAELLLDISERDALTVPLNAVVNPGSSHSSVFCVRENIVKRIPVHLGSIYKDSISVQGNLNAGDQVVIRGRMRLRSRG